MTKRRAVRLSFWKCGAHHYKQPDWLSGVTIASLMHSWYFKSKRGLGWRVSATLRAASSFKLDGGRQRDVRWRNGYPDVQSGLKIRKELQSEKSRGWMHNHVCGDGLKIRPQPTFCLKAIAKFRPSHEIQDSR